MYAEHLETGDLRLWTEPLIGWALVEATFPDEDGRGVVSIERLVEGLVSYGAQGPTLVSQTAGFVLTYVQPEDDLEPHRHSAETLISAWEQREREEQGYFQETNGGEEPC